MRISEEVLISFWASIPLSNGLEHPLPYPRVGEDWGPPARPVSRSLFLHRVGPGSPSSCFDSTAGKLQPRSGRLLDSADPDCLVRPGAAAGRAAGSSQHGDADCGDVRSKPAQSIRGLLGCLSRYL